MRAEAQLGKKRETNLQVTLHKAEKMIEEQITLEIIFKAAFLLVNLKTSTVMHFAKGACERF